MTVLSSFSQSTTTNTTKDTTYPVSVKLLRFYANVAVERDYLQQENGALRIDTSVMRRALAIQDSVVAAQKDEVRSLNKTISFYEKRDSLHLATENYFAGRLKAQTQQIKTQRVLGKMKDGGIIILVIYGLYQTLKL